MGYREDLESALEYEELLTARLAAREEERDSGKVRASSARMHYLLLDIKAVTKQLVKARTATRGAEAAVEYENTLLERARQNRSGAI